MLTGSPNIVNSFNVNKYSTNSFVNIPISEPSPYLEQHLDSVSMALFDSSDPHRFSDAQTWDEPEESFYDTHEPPSLDTKYLVDTFLDDINYHQLMGKNKCFNTMVFALQTLEQIQNLELIQLNLA